MEIAVGDILFVDTNVLLTATDESRSGHIDAKRLIGGAGRCGCNLALSGQVLREYLVVATRPVELNGLGLSPDQAVSNLTAFRRHAVLLEESEVTSRRLTELVECFCLQGKRIHDANIVATMATHAISQLITENTGDFKVFNEITIATVADAARTMPGLGEGRRP